MKKNIHFGVPLSRSDMKKVHGGGVSPARLLLPCSLLLLEVLCTVCNCRWANGFCSGPNSIC